MNSLLRNYPNEDRNAVEQQVRLITADPEDLEAITDVIVAAKVLYRATAFHRNPDLQEAVKKLMNTIHSLSGDYLRGKPLEIAGFGNKPTLQEARANSTAAALVPDLIAEVLQLREIVCETTNALMALEMDINDIAKASKPNGFNLAMVCHHKAIKRITRWVKQSRTQA